jgi:iron complex transport system substrate-binding protein
MLRSLLFSCLLALAACHSAPDTPAAGAFHTVRDDMGRSVRLPLHPRRVLALAPSMTEMLAAVADSGQLVGRTQNCNYPPSVLSLPVVNTYPLDVEAIVKLHPDAVFTVEGMTSGDNITRLEKLGIPVYQQAYDSVKDVYRGLRELGSLLGHPENGVRAVQVLDDSLSAYVLRHKRMCGMGVNPIPLRVLAITWTDPIYVYGAPTLFSHAVYLSGMVNAVPKSIAQPYPVLPRETVLKLDPDIIIGGDFAALDTTLFRRYPELKQLRAYKGRRIYAIDDDLMSRPSPRIMQLMNKLRDIARQNGSGVLFVPPKRLGRQQEK